MRWKGWVGVMLYFACCNVRLAHFSLATVDTCATRPMSFLKKKGPGTKKQHTPYRQEWHFKKNEEQSSQHSDFSQFMVQFVKNRRVKVAETGQNTVNRSELKLEELVQKD